MYFLCFIYFYVHIKQNSQHCLANLVLKFPILNSILNSMFNPILNPVSNTALILSTHFNTLFFITICQKIRLITKYQRYMLIFWFDRTKETLKLVFLEIMTNAFMLFLSFTEFYLKLYKAFKKQTNTISRNIVYYFIDTWKISHIFCLKVPNHPFFLNVKVKILIPVPFS